VFGGGYWSLEALGISKAEGSGEWGRWEHRLLLAYYFSSTQFTLTGHISNHWVEGGNMLLLIIMVIDICILSGYCFGILFRGFIFLLSGLLGGINEGNDGGLTLESFTEIKIDVFFLNQV
jgi:hypothetical protein